MEIGETCLLFQIFQEEGTEKEVFDDYASSFHQKLKTVKPIKGFTTWYRHYQDIDEKKALIDLDAVSRSSIPFDVFQLDDGYETEIGDWVVPDKKKFPSGFAPLVRKIREADLIPGIWLAPFVASKNSQVFLSHPDWFLKDSQGQYLYHGGNWNGAYVLDFEKEEVREHIRFVLQALRKEGFSLFKLDFLYAVTLGENKTKSRGQRMCEAMEFLRKELSDSLILSCGVPLAPSFFLTDYCRIGPDVSLTYDDAFYMKLAHRERISTRITLKNTYYRRQLDRRFFLNDPDVFLQKGTKLKDKVKEEMFRVDSQYGSVFFTSDDLSLYSREETERFASLGKERSER
jgi:alpha-galactosidase